MSALAIDLLESYAALFIAIEYNLESADAAFMLMDHALDDPFFKRTKGKNIFRTKEWRRVTGSVPSDEDTQKMIKLREQKVTYRDIGMIYGLTDQVVYQRIRYYKQKRRKADDRNCKGILCQSSS